MVHYQDTIRIGFLSRGYQLSCPRIRGHAGVDLWHCANGGGAHKLGSEPYNFDE